MRWATITAHDSHRLIARRISHNEIDHNQQYEKSYTKIYGGLVICLLDIKGLEGCVALRWCHWITNLKRRARA